MILRKFKKGLLKIKDEIKNDKMIFKSELEDIHTHIETRLIEIIGPVGKKTSHRKIKK